MHSLCIIVYLWDDSTNCEVHYIYLTFLHLKLNLNYFLSIINSLSIWAFEHFDLKLFLAFFFSFWFLFNDAQKFSKIKLFVCLKKRIRKRKNSTYFKRNKNENYSLHVEILSFLNCRGYINFNVYVAWRFLYQ